MSGGDDIRGFLAEIRETVDGTLDRLLPPEDEPPERLHRAMRYTVLGGGKRLRPALLVAALRSLDGDDRVGWNAAAAVEMIHTYSLVHDDLPAMDDDELRRGRPTCHVAFDEATAILAGDALLTQAFEVLASLPDVSTERRAAVAAEIGRAVGSRGMIAGQVLDLEAEGKVPGPEMLERIHLLKTAALIRASVASGGILAGASPEEADALRTFGESIGLAFQIVDDLLDVQGETAVLGKTAGKDARAEKATFPAVFGLEESRRLAEAAAGRAREGLALLGDRGAMLAGLADFVLARDR